jgi:hypothetical protein
MTYTSFAEMQAAGTYDAWFDDYTSENGAKPTAPSEFDDFIEDETNLI